MILKRKSSFANKFLLSFGLIVVSSAYALWQNIRNEEQASVPPMVGGGMMNGMRGTYADGSYTGDPTDAYYGTLQVKAIVRGGNIVDVQFLQHADSTPNSRMINDQAMPLLTEEAIQMQSAQVNGVSGATFTTKAFRESLASALALAKN